MRVAIFNEKTNFQFSVEFSSHVFNFYYVFCLFGYHTLLIPYKFVLTESGYKVRTNKMRKVLCFIVHFCILILGVGNLRKKFSVDKIVDKPNQFFIMAEGICLFSYILVFIHMYQLMAVLMHMLAIFSCGAHLFVDTFYGYASFKKLICSNAAKFYYGFHMTDSDLPLEEYELTTATTVTTLMLFVIKIWLRLSSHFTELSFYMGAISVALIINDFLSILSRHPKLSVDQIAKCYDDMKLFIDNINSICGGFVVVVFAASVPHFARDSIAIFDSTDYWLKFDYMQYAFFYLASLIYVAEATNNMKEFSEYLFNYTKNEKAVTDMEKLKIIVMEKQSVRYPIGLQGYGFFTITYKFLGSVCSIMITYTIILLQLQ